MKTLSRIALALLALERVASACTCPASDDCCSLGPYDCFGQASGCFETDPCGRNTDFPMCGTFVADNAVNPSDPSGPIGSTTVECGSCPFGNDQCGATVYNPYASGTYFLANACVASCSAYGSDCTTSSATAPPAAAQPGWDSWGATLFCGGCESGVQCVPTGASEYATQCCAPVTDCGEQCGTVSNGCGGTLSCPACSAPSPACATCGSLGASCGVYSNGCGGTVACGACATGASCSTKTLQCTAAADPADPPTPAPALPTGGLGALGALLVGAGVRRTKRS